MIIVWADEGWWLIVVGTRYLRGVGTCGYEGGETNDIHTEGFLYVERCIRTASVFTPRWTTMHFKPSDCEPMSQMYMCGGVFSVYKTENLSPSLFWNTPTIQYIQTTHWPNRGFGKVHWFEMGRDREVSLFKTYVCSMCSVTFCLSSESHIFKNRPVRWDSTFIQQCIPLVLCCHHHYAIHSQDTSR